MRFRRVLPRAMVVAAALVSVAVAGCGSSSSSSSGGSSSGSSSNVPGVTATSITFGSHQPLTGPVAPGYSEIAPASQAFFDYVNAHGGVFGRKIHLIYKDDAYNPAQTVNVVHQLVLQDKVFGIFEGLGTPTHTKVVGFLNAEKIPDMFVASGCPCWDDGTKQPYTFGWQPNYTIEGKILGQYLKQHFAGKKVGILYQDDDFGLGGLAGIEDEVPASDIVAKESYQPGTTTLAAQITAIKTDKAQVMVDFTVPIYTAIAQLTSFTLGYKPQLVVSNVGIDPITVGGLSEDGVEGQGIGDRADRGRDHRRLPALVVRYVEPVDPAVHEDPSAVRRKRTVRRQRRVRDGERVHACPGASSRRQEPDPAGPGERGQHDGLQVDRTRTCAVPLLNHRARWLRRRRDGAGPQRQDRSVRRPAGHLPDSGRIDHALHRHPARTARERRAVQLSSD